MSKFDRPNETKDNPENSTEKNTEKEKLDKKEKPEEKETGDDNKSALDKLKDRLSSLGDKFKKKEGEDNQETKDNKDTKDTKEKKNEESKPWDLKPEEKKKVEDYNKSLREGNEKQEKKTDGNGDDNADAKTHGEDGERTRYSDKAAEDQKNKNKEDDLER